MISLIRILLWDYLRTGRIAVEVVLLFVFVWFSKPVMYFGTEAYASLLAWFCLALVPITVLRLAKRSFLCSHYLIASGPGRTQFLIGVLTSAILIDVIAVGLAAFIPSAWIAWDAQDMALRFLLVFPFIAMVAALCLALSRLVVARVGSLIAVAVLVFLAFMDPSSSEFAFAKEAVTTIDPYLPPIRESISALGGPTADFSLLPAILLLFFAGISLAAMLAFHRRELIFDE